MTPQNTALIVYDMQAGITRQIGIDPTCRQGSDLGFWPILVGDACGFGNEEAATHSLASLKHMGDTTITDVEAVCGLLAKFVPQNA